MKRCFAIVAAILTTAAPGLGQTAAIDAAVERGAVDEERVVSLSWRLGGGVCRGSSKLVGLAYDERRKGVPMVQWGKGGAGADR